ncbi:protein tamozhennic isoform X1 [Schistocerca serialis cubense]|uniref:protein tamozhennic isoform X1 n=2 Tax=Schistocerca serialis cubense TaxID=2023355 RepID=UPI00214F4C88|nr:protein tamozhennic isoform X1 [Schistocerca serialis cubense]
MADFLLHDRVRELWMQIDQLHLSYLQTDESLYKLEQREKLEGYIREYLCLVPHDQKFCFRETADVLHRSAITKEDFSGYRAASAWNAIGLYAANLLSQPWRKEYREMKMYCGFYKHEVEANLIGAELMLEAMGYKHTGSSIMVLDGPIDPDRVSNVSRDSLVAFVECQLLKHIWEEVSSRFHCTWLDVLEYRENHAGSPENATRGLIYRLHQRHYQEQQQVQQQQQQQKQQLISAPYHHPPPAFDTYGTSPHYHSPAAGCVYGQIQHHVPHLGYNYYSPTYALGNTHAAYTLPSQSRYAGVTSVPQSVPYQVAVPAPVHTAYQVPPAPHPVLKSQDLYPNSSHIHQFPGPLAVNHIPPQAVQNGYPPSGQLLENPTVMQNYGYTVPTGQLIELENTNPAQSTSVNHQQSFPGPDSSILIPRVVKQHSSQAQLKKNCERQVDSSGRFVAPVNSQDHLSYLDDIDSIEDHPSLSKAKEDGKGTFDAWNYVFKSLESQGYSKDLADRPNVLSPEKHSKSNHKEPKPSKQQAIEMSSLENTLMELRLEEYHKKISSPPERRPMKINEALHRMKLECDGEGSRNSKKTAVNENLDGRGSVYDNMSSPPKEVMYSEVSRLNVGGSSDVAKMSKTFPKESKKNVSKKGMKEDNDIYVKPHTSKTSLGADAIESPNDYYSAASVPSRERPVSVVTETSKSNVQVNKSSTKTLPREPKKHSKKNVQSSVQYSSATLDLRRISDHTNRVNPSGDVPRSNEKELKQKDCTEVSNFSEHESDKWECSTCTFLNNPTREVCEMCGKSKVRGSEIKPLASGGRECPQCTLVNEKGVDTCIACDCSLKDSPTYI